MPLTLPPLPPPAIINNEVAAGVGVSTVLAANTVYLFSFELLTRTTITKARWRMGVTTTGTANIGIYTLAGSIVPGSDTGAVTNIASSEMSFTYGSALSLAPGQYLAALAPSNSTDTYFVRTFSGTMLTSHCRAATNVLSAGALPSTTGTLLTTNLSPTYAFLVSGGLA